MAELQIYDSQGRPIRGGAGGENQQVKDFFFDGVRLAVDSNRNEMFCFFRARDNDTARSEQYYARYSFRTRSELSGIYEAVETRIESEYGMILDTENEDTRFFELLGSSESGRAPESSELDDVATLLSDFKSARIGVGSYSEAYGLFGKFFSNDGVGKIAVSDNATGQSLSAYDLVIEKGDYFGVELLGDTEEKVETLREQRRSAFESEYGTEDDNDPISGLMGAALFAGIGVALVLAVIYGSCLGLGIGLIGDPPGATCGPSLGDVNADAVNGSQQIRITGVINGMSDGNATVNVTVVNETGAELLRSSESRQLDGSGNFSFTVQPDTNVSSLAPGNYTATVGYQDMQKNATFTVGNGSETTASVSSVSVSGPVDSSASSIQVDGTTTGLTNQTVSLRANVTSADGTSVSSTGPENVTVGQDGTFSLSVPFDANGTQGPYTVAVRYDGTVTNTTFETGSSTPPQLESVTVSNVDPGAAKVRLRGNISNFTGSPDQQVSIRLENETSTVYESTVPVEISADGTFDEFGVNVSDSGSLPSGNYTLVVTYDGGTPDEDMFSV